MRSRAGRLAVGAGCLVGGLAALVVAAGPPRAAARSRFAASIQHCPPAASRPHETLLRRPQWLGGTVITEYYPAPERWFSGRLVHAPGIPGVHHIDWLYGGEGLAMEGEGVGRDGRFYHFRGPYTMPWVNAAGEITTPCADGSWTRGVPSWLNLGWRNSDGRVTYPLADGGWSNGPPTQRVAPQRPPLFGLGPSLPLAYWHSAAVDPRLIPMGSRIFTPAYCDAPSKGWLVAADTGGAIIARHIDVYRTPPATPFSGRMLRGQRIFVVPPGTSPQVRPRCP